MISDAARQAAEAEFKAAADWIPGQDRPKPVGFFVQLAMDSVLLDPQKAPQPSDTRFAINHPDRIELLIYGTGGGYPIEHSRMDTPEKVLGWILHLCKKRTIRPGHIRAIIETAEQLGCTINYDV